MPLDLVIKKNTTIGTLELDATLSIAPTLEADVTDHPVEEGADVTDHHRPKPVEVKIEGVVTNTPFDTSDISSLRAVNAFEELNYLRETGTPVTIVTHSRHYTNMVLKSLSAPQDAKAAEALFFTAVFRQIETVSSRQTTIVIPKARPKTNAGPKPKTEQRIDNRSAAAKGLDYASKNLGNLKKWSPF